MNHKVKQIFLDDPMIDTLLPSISIPITLQRLVMESGANQDFSLIHHNNDAATATGASGAYASIFFIIGMFERLLREWMGLKGNLMKINSLRMSKFNCASDVLTFRGKVRSRDGVEKITLDLWAVSNKGITVTAEATVKLPQRLP